MRHSRLPLLAGMLLALFWTSRPGEAAVFVRCWKAVQTQPCVSMVVANTAAEILALTNAPDGVHAVAIDTQTLYCPVSGVWTACGSGGGSLIVEEDNSTVDASTAHLDFFEPDTTITSSSPAGEVNVNLAAYALKDGRSGGQYLNGGTSTGECLSLLANASDVYPRLQLCYNAGNAEVQLLPDASGEGGITSTLGAVAVKLSAGQEFLVRDASSVNQVSLSEGGDVSLKGELRIGDLSPSGSTCIGSDSDRVYGDVDCDGVKDMGEEYLDEAPGGGGLADADYGDFTVAGGVASIDANAVALGTDTTGNYAAGDAEAGNATGVACSDCVALGTETTGNYAAGDAEGGAATTGDSATAFFSAGAIEAARGGTGGAPTGDDYVPIATSSSAIGWVQIPDCDNGSTSKLLYDQATNTLSCGTDQSGANTGAPYGQYDPLHPPSSGLDASASDEFSLSLAASYTGGNSPSVSWELGMLRIDTTASASVARKVVWYPVPNSGDWTMTTWVHGGVTAVSPNNMIYGAAALVSGSIATPTLMELCVLLRTSGNMATRMYNSTSYTAAYSNLIDGGSFAGDELAAGSGVFVRYRFVDSSNNLSCDISRGGMAWHNIGTRSSLAANPSQIGLLADQDTANVTTAGYFGFIRTCTSGACISTPWPIGE